MLYNYIIQYIDYYRLVILQKYIPDINSIDIYGTHEKYAIKYKLLTY